MQNSYTKGSIIFNAISILSNLTKAGVAKEKAMEFATKFQESDGSNCPDIDVISAELEMSGIPAWKVTDGMFRFARLGEYLRVSVKTDSSFEQYQGSAHQSVHGASDAFFSILTEEGRYVNVKRGDKVTRGQSSFIL